MTQPGSGNDHHGGEFGRAVSGFGGHIEVTGDLIEHPVKRVSGAVVRVELEGASTQPYSFFDFTGKCEENSGIDQNVGIVGAKLDRADVCLASFPPAPVVLMNPRHRRVRQADGCVDFQGFLEIVDCGSFELFSPRCIVLDRAEIEVQRQNIDAAAMYMRECEVGIGLDCLIEFRKCVGAYGAVTPPISTPTSCRIAIA